MTDAAQAEPDGKIAEPQKPAENPAALRKHTRIKVSKTARLIFSNGARIYNCLVLDESNGGLQVELGGLVEIPDEGLVQYSNGVTFRVLRRRVEGTKIGFQFASAVALTEETTKQLQAMLDILARRGAAAAAAVLRDAGYFDSHEMRRLAEDAETAHANLKSALERSNY